MMHYLTITDFLKALGTKEACLNYLIESKWGDGFECSKCGHALCYKGRTWYYRKCRKCQYDESCTAGTLFHKIKFPIEKAFHMMWIISTTKKGISVCELQRQFGVHKKTAWFFKRKVQQAMQAKDAEKLAGIVEADEAVVGGKEANMPGRSLGKKKIVHIAIETNRDDDGENQILRAQATQLFGYSSENLKAGLEKMVEKDSLLLTDQWSGYNKGAKAYVHWYLPSKKGENFKKLHWHIFNLKNWLRGIHHHVSIEHVQRYLDEFNFRFNRRGRPSWAMNSLVSRMMNHGWLPYKMAIGN